MGVRDNGKEWLIAVTGNEISELYLLSRRTDVDFHNPIRLTSRGQQFRLPDERPPAAACHVERQICFKFNVSDTSYHIMT